MGRDGTELNGTGPDQHERRQQRETTGRRARRVCGHFKSYVAVEESIRVFLQRKI